MCICEITTVNSGSLCIQVTSYDQIFTPLSVEGAINARWFCCLGWWDAPKGAVFAVTGFTPLSYSGTPLPRLCITCSLSGCCWESMSGWLPGNQTVSWALWTYMVLRLCFLFFDTVWTASVCADSPQSPPETRNRRVSDGWFLCFSISCFSGIPSLNSDKSRIHWSFWRESPWSTRLCISPGVGKAQIIL